MANGLYLDPKENSETARYRIPSKKLKKLPAKQVPTLALLWTKQVPGSGRHWFIKMQMSSLSHGDNDSLKKRVNSHYTDIHSVTHP